MLRFLSVVMLCLWPLLAGAQIYENFTSTTVNDFAEVLDQGEREMIARQLGALKADHGVEMTLVTLPSQSAYAPDQTLEQFATGLFNAWGVGDAKRNDGIMVLVLTQDRAMRIELGAGYGRAWDGVARDVVDETFLPVFRADDYPRALRTGVSEVINRIALPFTADETPPKNNDSWIIAIGIFVCTLPFVLIAFWTKIRDLIASRRPCPQCGNKGGIRITRETLRAASRTLGGLHRKIVTCTLCAYVDEQEYTSSIRNDDSDSSGFGGGRSGGGGASGRW